MAMKILKFLILFLFLTTVSYATNVVTGFGYITDSNGHIIAKAEYPKGNVSIASGLMYTEVANQSALDAVTLYQSPVVIPLPLCFDYNQYIALATSLGLPAHAQTSDVQKYVTTLKGDGSNMANVVQAMTVSIEFLSLMNDIQQNGGSWSGITSC
jgi:hypothetical protein